ncbi:MAG: CPBP family intramembrane metalloprotease [Candidatus Tenebribacter burtonii]|nr:CPBP family intramembrane metalloprotease [Candidatus Tenebribacter burtonii]
MNKLLKKPMIVLILVLMLGYIIYTGSGKISSQLVKLLPEIFQTDFYLKNISLKFLFVVFSIVAMLLIPKMKLRDFGLRLPKKINYFKLIWQTVALTIGGGVIYGLLFMGLLRSLFGDTGEMGFPDSGSFLKTIITVWLWSSICEEILNRGLIQSLLNVFKKYKFCRLTLSVWISGIIFGAMHFSVLRFSSSIFFVLFIVCGATTLGVLAAYYREKSESVYPAIMVHILGNVAGSLPLLIKAILG